MVAVADGGVEDWGLRWLHRERWSRKGKRGGGDGEEARGRGKRQRQEGETEAERKEPPTGKGATRTERQGLLVGEAQAPP